MHFKPLLKVSCFISLFFFSIPVIAQNMSAAGDGSVASKPFVKGRIDTNETSYGLPLKKDAAAAVSTLNSENFNQGAIFNPADQLAGKVAGLTITESGGDPNQNAAISIRGQASLLGNLSPLFVVDGVILDNAGEFQNIPPDDIASYTVLKDASSSAIYGSRGANGVIIVTTKKGSTGRPVISFNSLVGEGVQSKYYDLLNASQYINAISQLPNVTVSAYNKGANTDWQKAITHTGIENRNSLSVSGGSNTFNYLGAVDYQNQQGIVLNSDKQQLGFHFDGELKAFANKLDINAGIQNVNTTRKLTDYSIFSYVYNAPPTYPVKNADGSYYEFTDFNLENPVEHFNEEVLGEKEHLNLIHASADYSITHDLKIGVLGSASLNKIQNNEFIPSFPDERNPSETSLDDVNVHSYNVNAHLNYDKTFGKSILNLLGAYEYHDYSNTFDYNFSNGSSGLYKAKYQLKSFIGRAAYNYDNRFYADVTLRQDDLLNSGITQHGYFPSLNLAYHFKKDIFSDINWIDDMKLRAGYGITGNSTDQSGQPLLQWEKVYGSNVGLDFSLFNGRLSGDLNYFNDQTKDLLILSPVPSPPFLTNTLLTNVGSMVNKGLEISLSGQIISGHKLNWTVNGQITFITTTITNLSGQYNYNGQNLQLNPSQIPAGYAEGRGLSSNPISFLKAGYSPYVFYLPHYTGVNAQGDQTFDGQTIAQNPNPAGHYIDPAPKFNYGITNNFSYGNWNLNVALRGVYGQKVFDNTLLNVETITRLPGNNVTQEALTNGIKDAPVPSDRWLENASFLRLDNATLGYSFKNVSFASVLRVFVAANNLLVITKYKGQDPEVRTENSNSNGGILSGQNVNGSLNQPYIDSNYNGQAYYPKARIFSLGVNVSLK